MLHRQEFRYRGDGLLAEQKFYENGVLVDTVCIVRDGMLALQDRDGENAIVREYTWGLHLGGGIGGQNIDLEVFLQLHNRLGRIVAPAIP